MSVAARRFCTFLLSTALGGSLVAPVVAQTAPAADSGSVFLEEIVVTARKRAEASQEVPMAISAFSNDTLDRQAVDDSQDLQFLVPNLMLVGNDRPTIRGVGNNAISSTADNGTGVLLNFAPIGVRPGDEFFDVERIEVLRGPQGTLYGRNTTGGTLNLITRKAGEDFGGYASLQLGNYDTIRTHGAINIPLNDAVQQRFAYFYLKRDGYTKNVGPAGGSIDGRDQYSVRSATHLNLSENTRADLMFQYSKEDSTRSRENKRLCSAVTVLGCSPFQLGFDSPATSGGAVLFQTLLGAFTGSIHPAGANIYAGAPNPTDLRTVAIDTPSSFKAEQTSATLEIAHDFDKLTLVSLTAHSWSRSDGATDYDNAALPYRFLRPVTYNAARGTPVTTDQLIATDNFSAANRTWYQEFRLSSSLDGPFNFTAGSNYFHSRGRAAFEIWHPAIELFAKNIRQLPAEAQYYINESPYTRTKSWAVFGEGYYNLSDDTKVTVGLRYTEDDKAIRTRTIFLAAPPPYTLGAGKFDAVTGKVSIDHKLRQDGANGTLLWASYARGFKSGGLNAGNSGTPSFRPEEINAYEAGVKNTLADGNLSLNLSSFYYDYSDLQLGQRTGLGTLTVNGDADIWGLEGEMQWAPTRELLLNANLAYLNTEIGAFATADPANPAQWNGTGTPTKTPLTTVNLKGNELPYAPDTKITLGAQYTLDVGDTGWTATVRGDYSWQSKYWAREFNTANDRIKSWSTTNAILRFINPDDTITVELFVKNIANKDNITNSIVESDLVGNYRNVRVLEPRTWGVTTQFKF